MFLVLVVFWMVCGGVTGGGNLVDVGGDVLFDEGLLFIFVEGCAGSELCFKMGKCMEHEDGYCVVTDDMICCVLENCGVFGLCFVDGIKCIVILDDDCLVVDMCLFDGYCGAEDGICIVEINVGCLVFKTC